MINNEVIGLIVFSFIIFCFFPGDDFAAEFLISHKCDVNMATHLDKETPLHIVATFDPSVSILFLFFILLTV